jgi:GT2 family glycosyltransferase
MMLARREVWQALGGFRDDFFIYGEDTDLCFRAGRAGYRITVVPAARVRHLPGAGGPPSELTEFHKLKNFFALYLLHARWSVWPGFFLRYVLLDAVRTHGARGRLLRKALGWNARNLRRLLADRGAVRARTREA